MDSTHQTLSHILLVLLMDVCGFVNEAHSQTSELLSSKQKRQAILSSAFAEMDYITAQAIDAMISKAIQLLLEAQLELRKLIPGLPPPKCPQLHESTGADHPATSNYGTSEMLRTSLQTDNTQSNGSYLYHMQSAFQSPEESFRQPDPIQTSTEPVYNSGPLQSTVTMAYDTPTPPAQSQMPKIGYKRPRVESEPSVPGDHWLWRKYGQKVIKTEGIVRRYYRCAHKDGDTVCLAKRQVDYREDSGKIAAVMYEGKHNHEIPSSKSILRPVHEDSSAILTGD